MMFAIFFPWKPIKRGKFSLYAFVPNAKGILICMVLTLNNSRPSVGSSVHLDFGNVQDHNMLGVFWEMYSGNSLMLPRLRCIWLTWYHPVS